LALVDQTDRFVMYTVGREPERQVVSMGVPRPRLTDPS
jgi:hypothetical protein